AHTAEHPLHAPDHAEQDCCAAHEPGIASTSGCTAAELGRLGPVADSLPSTDGAQLVPAADVPAPGGTVAPELDAPAQVGGLSTVPADTPVTRHTALLR